MRYGLSLSRLETIIENEGFDCTRFERGHMAKEIIQLRKANEEYERKERERQMAFYKANK